MNTPPVFWPLLLYVRAGASGRAGRLEEGLAFIDEAIEIGGWRRDDPSVFHGMKGDLLLVGDERGRRREQLPARIRPRRGTGRDDAATPRGRRAVPYAGWAEAARRRASCYRAAYAEFTENSTPDLTDAAALLEPQAA